MCDELVMSWCFRICTCISFNSAILCCHFCAVILRPHCNFSFEIIKFTLPYLTLHYLSKAFDKVWKERLLLKLLRAGVHGKMYKWLSDFLFNRTARVKLDGTISRQVKLREGERCFPRWCSIAYSLPGLHE